MMVQMQGRRVRGGCEAEPIGEVSLMASLPTSVLPGKLGTPAFPEDTHPVAPGKKDAAAGVRLP